MSARLALVTLLVQDMPRAKAFYTDLLGFEVIQDFSSPAGDFLFLHSRASDTNIALQDATRTTYGVPLVHGGIMLGFAVEDADAVYRDWQSKSVEILGEVGDMGAGRLFPTDGCQNVEEFYCLGLVSHCCSGGPPRSYAVESRTASQSKSVKL